MADMDKFFEDLKSFDVNDIDFNRVGVWPLPGRIFLALLLIAALVAGCYFLLVKDRNVQLQGEVVKEERLRKDFEDKAFEAANLEAYSEQMKQMQETFAALKSRLPQDTEVPGLLEDIDDKGVESSLVLDEIELQPEVAAEIHIELPISISVTGGYHEFGAFVSGIAGMPRIVTLHDFEIEPQKENFSGLLNMSLQAKTYRYKPEE
jgi:type IV pilus assembly protein PilO